MFHVFFDIIHNSPQNKYRICNFTRLVVIDTSTLYFIITLMTFFRRGVIL